MGNHIPLQRKTAIFPFATANLTFSGNTMVSETIFLCCPFLTPLNIFRDRAMNTNHEHIFPLPLFVGGFPFSGHPCAVFFRAWIGRIVAVGRLLDKLLRRLFRQPVHVVKSQLPLYGLCLFPVGACVVLLVQETEQNQLYLHNSNGLGIVWRICRSLSSHNQFVYHARKRQRSVTEPFRYLPLHNLLVDILPRAFRAGGLRLHPVSFPEALCA